MVLAADGKDLLNIVFIDQGGVLKIAQKKRESALDAKFPMNDYVDFWGKVKVKGHVGFCVIELIWERFFSYALYALLCCI